LLFVRYALMKFHGNEAIMSVDLFSYPSEREKKLHPNFVTLKSDLAHGPARKVLGDLQDRFTDPDGNFVEQFQTTGFDARTFELFLFALFEDQGHAIDRSFDRPDFLLTKEDLTVAVEAVTSNRSGGETSPYSVFGPERSHEALIDHLQNELAIRVGSPLFSKLQKKYWELPHVQGRPFVLALECFHEDGSLSHSSSPIEEYLFGTRHTWFHDAEENLIIVPQTVTEHRVNEKRIPSGFFNQPGAEYISAVLFCNTGTIAKFNRMGHQDPTTRSRYVRMFRAGAAYRHDENSSVPDVFLYEVGDPERVETWPEGTVLIHNPRALYPVPPGWLGSGIETRLQSDGQVIATFHGDGFLPYWSETHLIPLSVSQKLINRHLRKVFEALMAARENPGNA
jgi:hypothetical protein